jgi:hypothetical protein
MPARPMHLDPVPLEVSCGQMTGNSEVALRKLGY